MGALGDYYHRQCNEGNRDVIALLRAEAANLLHARRLALRYGWWLAIPKAMLGLYWLYDHTGRGTEWRALVEEIVPVFVDPTNDGPLPGREAEWGLVTQYRVHLLRGERQWATAAKLQGLQVDYQGRQATLLLAMPPAQLDAGQRNSLRSLGVALHELGEIQRGEGVAACVDNYQKGYDLALRIGDHAGAAACAFNLGHVYSGDVPALRDLAQAEVWYRRGLELTSDSDRLTRSKGLGQLGLVAHERFKEARHAKQPEAVLLEHWKAARQFYQQSLDLTPPDALNSLACAHDRLGRIYGEAGQTEQAVAHYCQSIRYEELAGNLYGAANTRYNIALAYANAGRFTDALLFAQAALHNYAQFGPAAANEAAEAQQLIAEIEEAMR